MSHFSRIRTKMVEKGPVLKALRDLDLTFEEGEDLTIQEFLGRKERVDIRVHIPGNRPVGLRWRENAFEIVGDWYGNKGSISQKDLTEKINQRYAYHAAREKFERQGFNLVEEKVEESGQIRLVLRRATD